MELVKTRDGKKASPVSQDVRALLHENTLTSISMACSGRVMGAAISVLCARQAVRSELHTLLLLPEGTQECGKKALFS
jgi:hypothetical protein